MSCLVTLFLVPALGLIYDAGGQLYFLVISLEGEMEGQQVGYRISYVNTIFISLFIFILSMNNTIHGYTHTYIYGYNYLSGCHILKNVFFF